MMYIQEKANAKLNLILDVVGKRPDGYHDIRTVFVSLKLCDVLTFTGNNNGQITLTCNVPGLPLDGRNLAWRAARVLKDEYSVTQGVHINLEKHIPVAAGLGGGSSDAAAVLRGLVRLWGLPRESVVLHKLAAALGSDVPYCLQGGVALGSRRGEVLSTLPPCPHFYVLLVNPGFPVSTAKVYQQLDLKHTVSPDITGMVQAIVSHDHGNITTRLANVLETSTFTLYPAVKELKETMSKEAPSLMCGSGATVFTLFTEREAAERVYANILASGITAWLTETEYNPQEEYVYV